METYGWDTAFCCTLDRANRALASGTQASPEPLIWEERDLVIRAELGTWQIVPGGSGRLIYLQIALRSGTLREGDAPPLDLTGVAVVVEVSLRMLPAMEDSAGAIRQLLTFNFAKVNTDPTRHEPGFVTPVRVLRPATAPSRDAPSAGPRNEPLPKFYEAVVAEAVARYLVDHGAALSFALAQIDLVQHGAGTWLSPTHSDYCYFETTDHRALFCIVGMTEDRSAEGLEPAIDPNLLDGSHEGAFALARDRFMERVVMPMLPGVYPGNTAADFAYSPASGAITNTRTLSTGKVKGYEPKIATLRVTADDGALRLHAEGTCDMNFLGVSMTFIVDARSPLAFDAKRQVIGFEPDPNPTASHDYQIPWLTRAAFLASGGLLGLAATEFAVPLVAGSIADGLTRQAGESMLAQNSTSSIAWAGTRKFSAQAAGLSDAFYFKGTFD